MLIIFDRIIIQYIICSFNLQAVRSSNEMPS